MILEITTLNFRMIQVRSMLYWIYWRLYVEGKHLVISLTS